LTVRNCFNKLVRLGSALDVKRNGAAKAQDAVVTAYATVRNVEVRKLRYKLFLCNGTLHKLEGLEDVTHSCDRLRGP
jgi:hypothetical protein